MYNRPDDAHDFVVINRLPINCSSSVPADAQTFIYIVLADDIVLMFVILTIQMPMLITLLYL